jgi:hypothetical protein
MDPPATLDHCFPVKEPPRAVGGRQGPTLLFASPKLSVCLSKLSDFRILPKFEMGVNYPESKAQLHLQCDLELVAFPL